MSPQRGGWEAIFGDARVLTAGDWAMVAFILAVAVGPALWSLWP